MFKEFKTFALKGNVLDLAIGVIIGSAFGKIVTSLVSDVIMPIIGVILGGHDFSKLRWVLSWKAPGVYLNYGSFIQSIIDFLIIAFSIFIFVKLITSFKKKEIIEEKLAVPSKEEILLTEIRDLLKAKN